MFALLAYLLTMPVVGQQAQNDCTGEACSVVRVRVSQENCYANPGTNPGFKVYIDNIDSSRTVQVSAKQYGTSLGYPPVENIYNQQLSQTVHWNVGCTQYFSSVPLPEHVVTYQYTIQRAVFVTR
jgi:hypothetical protein